MPMSPVPPKPADDVRAGVPPLAKPPATLPSREGLGAQFASLVRYLSQTEIHTYAFSVAANAILSVFPFIVMMFTLAHRVFRSKAMEDAIGDMLRFFLPTLPKDQDFVVRNMAFVAHSRSGVQIAAVVTLLISSTGVFLPLEVALNQVWGVVTNRSYLMNQAISLGLAMLIGSLAMASVALTAAQTRLLTMIFFGHVNNLAYHFLADSLFRISAVLLGITAFFLIYWILPNRKLRARAVLPTAIVMGLLWAGAKMLYEAVLPWLDFRGVYGPFSIAVGLMIWGFLTGLMLLAGAHFSATRATLRLAGEVEGEVSSAN
ncbi:MAG TPA: YihY/virulence factor BrkB family protein [Acidisarcina sp.]